MGKDECFDSEFSDTTPAKLKELNDKFFEPHLIHINDITKDTRLVGANPKSPAVQKWVSDMLYAMVNEQFVGFLLAIHEGETTDVKERPNHIVALPRIAKGPQMHHFWYLDSNYNPDAWSITRKAHNAGAPHNMYHWSHDIGTEATAVWEWVQGKFRERDTYYLYTAVKFPSEQSLAQSRQGEWIGKFLSTDLERDIMSEKSSALLAGVKGLKDKGAKARVSYHNGLVRHGRTKLEAYQEAEDKLRRAQEEMHLAQRLLKRVRARGG